MAYQVYKDIHVVVAEPDSDISGNLNAALLARGVRDISDCRSADALAQTLERKIADVIVCDVDLSGLDFTETTQRIRQGQLGQNPFVQVIGIVGPVDIEQIHDLAEAGMDGLLRKPVSAALVLERIESLALRRKPFIVTEDYVGPSRRKDPRPADSDFMVEVPNTLHSRTLDGFDGEQLREMIDEAREMIEQKKAECRLRTIDSLTREILLHYREHASKYAVHRALDHLSEKCDRLAERHQHSESAHIAEVAETLASLARRIAQAPATPKRADIALFSLLSKALRRCLATDDNPADTVREIAMTVRKSFEQPQRFLQM